MTSPAITISPSAAVSQAARSMIDHGINRLPVVADGRLVGIVARANLLQALAGLKVETPVRQAGKDAEIREEILARLSGAPWRPWLFNVTVHDGVADLWGIANAAEEKKAAGVAAENAPGIFSVNNHIIVRPHNWAQAKPFFATDAKER